MKGGVWLRVQKVLLFHFMIGWSTKCSSSFQPLSLSLSLRNKSQYYFNKQQLQTVMSTTASSLRCSDHPATSSVDENAATAEGAPTVTTSEPSNRHMVVILAGPTAVGKSDVAARLCELHKGIIISADSVQAYRGVHIGANKPSKEERERTPHLLVDVADHTETYNAAEWTRDAHYCIQGVLRRQSHVASCENKDSSAAEEKANQLDEAMKAALEKKGLADNSQSVLPVVVGGTMMYLQWLVHGRPDAMRPTEKALKVASDVITNFQKQSDWEGAAKHVGDKGEVYQNQLEKLAGKDWYRLRRLLEVALTVEEKEDPSLLETLYSGHREGGLQSMGYDVRCFFLCPNDRMAHTAIVDERCEQMIQRGLLTETRQLHSTGRLPDMATKAIGYRQSLDFLDRRDLEEDEDEELVFQEYLEEFTAATRRYAKRQMQWFRKDKDFFFIPVSVLKSKESRVESAAGTISSLISLDRDEFDSTRTQGDSLSSKTRSENEKQGKKMKFYQHRNHLLKSGSEALAKALEEAAECKKPKKARTD